MNSNQRILKSEKALLLSSGTFEEGCSFDCSSFDNTIMSMIPGSMKHELRPIQALYLIVPPSRHVPVELNISAVSRDALDTFESKHPHR
jgi:hypothetical protein